MAEEKRIEISLGEVVSNSMPVNEDVFKVSGENLRKVTYKNSALRKKNSRNIAKAYTGIEDAKTKAVEKDYYTGYDAFDVVAPDNDLVYLARIYEISSPHYAACHAKAANIVGLGYELALTDKARQRIEDAGEGEKVERLRRKLGRMRKELESRISSFNAEDTLIEILYKAWIDYEATGNGYIEIGRTATGAIGYLGHVPSTTVRVRRERDGFVQLVSNKAVFFRNYGDRKTKDPLNNDSRPNELIHIKKYTPTNSFYGIPDIIPAKNALAGDEFASRFNLDYFEHKAVPRYIIVVKGASLSETAEKKLHEFFINQLKGKSHRTLYIPLPADSIDAKVEFKMEPIEAGVQESSFNHYRKSNRDEILMAHRVPITKVGLAEGANLAVARDADKTFKEQVIRPEQDRLTKRVQRIFSELTDAFEFKLNEMSLTDEDTKSQIVERLVRNQVMLINEARAEFKLQPRSGGDVPFEMRPQQAADARANSGKTRTRDAERSSGQTDGRGEGRNAKGEGRSAE
jgi:PBSX family phage portal protein